MGTSGELVGEAAGVGGAGRLLQPGDELVDGEGLGEGGAGGGAAGRGGLGGGGLGSLGRGRFGLLGGRRRSDVLHGGGRRGGRSRGGSSRGLGGSGGGLGRGGGGGAGCGRPRAAGAARAGAVPDGRAGDGVAGDAVVDVDEDAWVGGGVGLGHIDARGERLGARRSDLDLAAAVVELRLALGRRLVEGDDLGAYEILARGEIGKREGDLALVADEVVDAPLAVGKAVLVQLDPDSARAVRRGGSDVHHDGALVGLE